MAEGVAVAEGVVVAEEAEADPASQAAEVALPQRVVVPLVP